MITTASITHFMTTDEAAAYGLATGLAAAREPDRAAWAAGIAAREAAEERAIANFVGPVRLNRRGQVWGVAHPALAALGGYLPLNGCYAPE